MDHSKIGWQPTPIPLTHADYVRVAELCLDKGYAAAFHVLLSRFRTDARVWRFIDLRPAPLHGLYFEEMLAPENDTFSGGERRMLRAAWSLFNDRCAVALGDLVSALDSHAFVALVEALKIYRLG